MADTINLQTIKQRFGIIGNSTGLNNALSIAVRVAPTNLTVLITGESGVGKEVFSQIIHNMSPRKHNPFIAVNCGAIPEGTIDSELFGHEKGSFTGAHEARKGYFESVKEGTIFLDEIGELPIGTQARLLRVLESGEYIRVGSSKVQKTDVRVVAATNVDLMDLVAKGKFREDLYYRLSTVPIKVPPLRERKEDIYLLFRKFVVDFSERQRSAAIQLDEEAQKVLANYYWPGNIRELKNVAEQLTVLAKDKVVSADELKLYIPSLNVSNLPALRKELEAEKGGGAMGYSERELMYKVIFDMKKDLNDLKQFIFNMAREGEHDVSDFPTLRTDAPASEPTRHEEYIPTEDDNQPIIINTDDHYEDEDVEESLSIADMERELIEKALRKHKNKRKDAALDLGISERTLYRKIKEYEING